MPRPEYEHVRRDGFSLDLPAGLTISGEGSKLLAASTDTKTMFYLDANTFEGVWDAVRGIIHQSLPPSNSSMSVQAVRQGALDTPHPGDELVFETRMKTPAVELWQWELALRVNDVRVHCQIRGTGRFSDSEPLWRHTIESLQVTSIDSEPVAAPGASEFASANPPAVAHPVPEFAERRSCSTSAKAYFAPHREADPALHGVFLVDETDSSDPHVEQYLVTKQDDQLFPIGGRRFDTLTEAFADCADALGTQPSDWQEVAEPPFHAAAQAAVDDALRKYIDAVSPKEQQGEAD